LLSIAFAAAALLAARVIKPDAQEFSVKGFAIKTAYGGPGFMPFHFYKSESPAFAGKDIGGYLYRTYSAVFRKEFTYIFF